MLYPRLIPSLLLKQGRLVKGVGYGHYKDAGNPKTTARAHNHQGADELLVMDIEASHQKILPDLTTLKQIADECFMPLCVGGGITDRDIARDCMQIGADKLCLTTTAIDQPTLIAELAHLFGSQAIVVGIDIFYDAHGVARLYDHRTQTIIPDLDPWIWMQRAVELGAGEIRLMCVNREGSLQGYDFALYQRARALLTVPIILEGGAGSLVHLQTAFENKIDGIAVGAMLVFSDANLVKIKKHMLTANCAVRE